MAELYEPSYVYAPYIPVITPNIDVDEEMAKYSSEQLKIDLDAMKKNPYSSFNRKITISYKDSEEDIQVREMML